MVLKVILIMVNLLFVLLSHVWIIFIYIFLYFELNFGKVYLFCEYYFIFMCSNNLHRLNFSYCVFNILRNAFKMYKKRYTSG